MSEHLKIVIIGDLTGPSLLLSESLGITKERELTLRKKVSELASKYCKEPCNGTCTILAIQEMAPDLIHANELFFLGSLNGYFNGMDEAARRDSIQIKITGFRAGE